MALLTVIFVLSAASKPNKLADKAVKAPGSTFPTFIILSNSILFGCGSYQDFGEKDAIIPPIISSNRLSSLLPTTFALLYKLEIVILLSKSVSDVVNSPTMPPIL